MVSALAVALPALQRAVEGYAERETHTRSTVDERLRDSSQQVRRSETPGLIKSHTPLPRP